MSKIIKAVASVFEVVIGAVLLTIPGWQPLGLALLTAGIQTGVSLFAPGPAQWRGDSLQISLDPTAPRKVAIHKTATGGSLVTWQTWGDQNVNLILIVALADHQCQRLTGLWWNGQYYALSLTGGGSSAISGAYVDGADHMWVTFYDGDWNQAADAELITVSGGRWTTNDRGRGVTYVKIKAAKNDKAHPQGLSGLFQIVYEFEGAALYDRRLDTSVGGSGAQRFNDQSTWAYNANKNAALALENLWRGFRVEDTTAAVGSRDMDTFYGLSLTDTDIPFDENVAAFNSCDESVGIKAGGTEPRYAASGILSCDQPVEAAQADLLSAMAGKALTGPRRWVILPGVARTPVRSFTDTSFRIDAQAGYQDFKPLGQIANCITGRFSDPSQRYQAIDLPPRRVLADATADGGLKVENHDLSMVTSQSQGQRLLEIHRRRARLQKTMSGTPPPENIDLEGGDVITMVDARHSFTADFEIQDAGLGMTDSDLLKIPVQLAETATSVYDWTPATDELDRTNPAPLPSTPPSAPSPTISGHGGGLGTYSISWQNPLWSNFYGARVWKATTGAGFGTATDASGLRLGPSNSSDTYAPTGVTAGTYDLWVTAEDSGGSQSTPAGPVTVTVT